MPRSLAVPLRAAWSWRRWVYAGWLTVALAWIPARTGFRLTSPPCDTRLTLENAGLSLTKVPHMVLFGIFFLLTVVQFDRIDRRAVLWSVTATLGVGLLVEILEGATRTGNCRLTDVLPNVLGALIAGALLVSLVAIGRHAAGLRGAAAARQPERKGDR